MVLFKLKKERSTFFPSLLDSLKLYKNAIIESVEEDDIQTAKINFSKLISILEYHNHRENRFNAELEEAKIRYMAFQKLSKKQAKSMRKVSVY